MRSAEEYFTTARGEISKKVWRGDTGMLRFAEEARGDFSGGAKVLNLNRGAEKVNRIKYPKNKSGQMDIGLKALNKPRPPAQ